MMNKENFTNCTYKIWGVIGHMRLYFCIQACTVFFHLESMADPQ